MFIYFLWGSHYTTPEILLFAGALAFTFAFDKLADKYQDWKKRKKDD
jgi:hypothetical protein